MTRTLTLIALALSSLVASRSFAQAPPPAAAPADLAVLTQHAMVTPADVKWGDAPPGLPPGSKFAVIYGDPSKAGLFIARAKVPANYKIPAHFHPTDETVTVITGSVMMGMGDKLDAKAATTLPAGSISIMPARNNHFFMSKNGAVIQIAAMGPFEITYVNPDDDPRKPKAATAPDKK